jgi:hypothetical protein
MKLILFQNVVWGILRNAAAQNTRVGANNGFSATNAFVGAVGMFSSAAADVLVLIREQATFQVLVHEIIAPARHSGIVLAAMGCVSFL